MDKSSPGGNRVTSEIQAEEVEQEYLQEVLKEKDEHLLATAPDHEYSYQTSKTGNRTPERRPDRRCLRWQVGARHSTRVHPTCIFRSSIPEEAASQSYSTFTSGSDFTATRAALVNLPNSFLRGGARLFSPITPAQRTRRPFQGSQSL